MLFFRNSKKNELYCQQIDYCLLYGAQRLRRGLPAQQLFEDQQENEEEKESRKDGDNQRGKYKGRDLGENPGR